MKPRTPHAFTDGLMDAFADFNPGLALEAVLDWSEVGIVARTAAELPPYLALEAQAQACGLHLRHRHDFAVRAFLASVSGLVHAPGLGHGPLTIRATLVAETSAGAAYDVVTDGAPACRMLMGHVPLASPDIFFRQRFEDLCTRC